LIIGVVLLLLLGVGVWAWSTSGRESTDDAQVDAHLTQLAARVSGTVTKVAVDDNQLVEAGALLVQLDPGDYQVAVDKARAELADAEATALAAQNSVPITSTTAPAM
jgi:membrane fusion protein (multidrug efflux system)